MILFPLILLFFGSHSQATAANPEPTPLAYTDHDAYEVYSAILPKELEWKKGQIAAIQLETSPGVQPACFSTDKGFLAEYGGLIENFTAANREPVMLQRQFRLRKKYELIQSDDRKKLLDWHGKSGGYVYLLSAVGFNTDRTRAVVMVVHICQGLCGGGGYHFLVKNGGKWKEESGFMSKETETSPTTFSITVFQKSCSWAY